MILYPGAKEANFTSEHLNDSRHTCQMWVLQDVKNSCLHKVYPETQNENILLVEYKSKLMFKARTVDPKSTKQKIFITWST